MSNSYIRGRYLCVLLILLLLIANIRANAQEVTSRIDSSEKPGKRPYEMVWANRKETGKPTLTFDDITGWTLQVSSDAQATLAASRAQNIWDRPVAALRYRGNGRSTSPASVRILLPKPITIPSGSDSIDMWLYGNRWEWVNPPGTPPVSVVLHLILTSGADLPISVDTIRWEEWWLMHRRFTPTIGPAQLCSIEVIGGWQSEWRAIYFDSIRFYRESLSPLKFAARPARNLTLFPGQSPGGNVGPGRLPFPNREETILPVQMAGPFQNSVGRTGTTFTFSYLGSDAAIRYLFDPAKGLAGISASVDGIASGNLMDGGAVRNVKDVASNLVSAAQTGQKITATYSDRTVLTLQIRQKSLLVDIANPSGDAREVSLGQITGVSQPRTIYVPPITYGGSNPSILLSRTGKRWVYTSIWPDWYRSNGSDLTGAETAGGTTAQINGSILYNPRTDGKRNPMYERLFLTVTPRFEEALPVVPNPVGLHAADAVDRLWQESWGPADYGTEMKRSEMIHAYGIDRLIQCNHEITWRDGGESFTLRTKAAPGKGGDEALRGYIKHQRGLGWNSGLYSNYTDFTPVDEYWSPDAVQRLASGEWRSAWPRCWAEKPMKAVEFDALLAPQIASKFKTNSAYTDVSTAVSPWGFNDYDARVPGAGTFAQTFYCHGELLRNDSRVYGGPIFSEGTYQWLYAGLADGNYGHTYNARSLATQPLLPVFDLYQIHTKECDIGVSWTAFFCDAIPGWQSTDKIDYAIDRFLLTEIAYGHIGWLVEEQHGIDRMCRSYYMLQQLQARYGLKRPSRIAYWDGATLQTVSNAVQRNLTADRRQIYLEYPGGLKIWLNDHPTEVWRVTAGSHALTLPPAGWVAVQATPSGEGFFECSALAGVGKADYVRSPSYIYIDARGSWYAAPEAASSGALAISKTGSNALRVIHISGKEAFMIRRPYGVRGTLITCRVFTTAGKSAGVPHVHDSGTETWIEPIKDGVRYELVFSGQDVWSASADVITAAPGSEVPLHAGTLEQTAWTTASPARIFAGKLNIPNDAEIGSTLNATCRLGHSTREIGIRICAPIELRWRTVSEPDHVYIALATTWHLKYLPLSGGVLSFHIDSPPGWTVLPQQGIPIDPHNPPAEVGFALYSAAPSGANGQVKVVMTGLPRSPTLSLSLTRVNRNPVTSDLKKIPFTWGIRRRGGNETNESGGSGAVCYTSEGLNIGDSTRAGIFMHPPYSNGPTGYTWADFRTILIPDAPSEFSASVGIKDGGNLSDGVRFILELLDAKGVIHRLVDTTGMQHAWRPVRADLSGFAGQRVKLRLIADPGPADNSQADWGCWAEPVVSLVTPVVETVVGVGK